MKTIYQQHYHMLIQYLIQARKDAQLTQAQVAQLLGKPQSYIAKIEVKDRKLDVLEFMLLCKVLNVQASKLLEKIEIHH